MKRYKVIWEEFMAASKGVKPRWHAANKVVDADNVMEAVKRVKRSLGDWHIDKFQCRNFKASEDK